MPDARTGRRGRVGQKGILFDPPVFIPSVIGMKTAVVVLLLRRELKIFFALIPTNQMLPRVVAVFKRLCNKEIGDDLFQRGYMEHIVRDREDYETRMKYMYENPIRRFYGE